MAGTTESGACTWENNANPTMNQRMLKRFFEYHIELALVHFGATC